MPAKLTAVLGACKRRGRWQVSNQTTAFVLLGHCYIDYREAYADDEIEKMKLKVTCILGNATFIVPEGADIQPSVVSLLASTGFDVPKVDGESPLPTLVIESTTLLGRCRVLTSPPGEEEEVDAESNEGEHAQARTPEFGGRSTDSFEAADSDILAAIAKVDQIGMGSTAPLSSTPVPPPLPEGPRLDDELPPLEAVAKALLAEPSEAPPREPIEVQMPKTEVESPSGVPSADAA
jgi:hypothetical protein